MVALRFTSEDLRRITIAPRAEAMVELAFSAMVLQTAETPGLGHDWKHTVAARLRTETTPIFDLVRQFRYFPDFLSPLGVADPAAGIDTVADTPVTDLETQLTMLREVQRIPTWTSGLAAGRLGARKELRTALRQLYRVALEPYWETISTRVHTDRMVRGQVMLNGGVDALLATLHPTLHWRPPILECVASVCTPTVDLKGRGLLLIPSVLAPRPAFAELPGKPICLFYPVRVTERPTDGAALAALLGATRAAVLQELANPSTTTQLADKVFVSPSAISQHTAVLRRAGLITTRRVGPAVMHGLTPLGSQLVQATPFEDGSSLAAPAPARARP
ncbi:helix-turn-helix transcriptional regulator [Actinomadura graeca]|uniref:Helix-turn-helix transcriptional regulator n=1 Tax=Actinomadura graeca TaxID=2750812 RepID=A0ABX8QUN2_9ACTN|nr:helix-turn-helix domain-containing protein [Actinomadura graeca]QXJ22456.1 helix-turn-helix transcriptional regulator [Actinomadura graeca]